MLVETELRQVVGINAAALAAVKSAFSWLEEGRVSMPPIMHIEARGRGDVDVKSAFVEGLPYFAIKIASGFFGNAERGLPAGSAMMVLLNSETGFCEAVLLDNSYLTDLRTGMAGAVAAEFLAPSAVGTVGVLGTGTQARYQVRCLRLVREFNRVIVWGRSAQKARVYAEDLQQDGEFEVTVAASAEEVVRACDVLITTTPSERPLVKAAWLRAGQHVTAVGADFPRKQELEAEVLRKADRLVCDRLSQCRENGELQHLAQKGELPAGLQVIELGALTMGKKKGRQTQAELTVCDLTGTGVQDTAIANLAYSEALQRGMGVEF
ncbi:MAG TPA: ornithine cyclodeaminase family protein [Woeseiaceae bacterium]